MYSSIFSQRSIRQGFALTLVLVVAFLGVAVFSSLHKHQGAKSRCSLNGYDQLMTGETEAAQAADAVLPLERLDASQSSTADGHTVACLVLLRGPPFAA